MTSLVEYSPVKQAVQKRSTFGFLRHRLTLSHEGHAAQIDRGALVRAAVSFAAAPGSERGNSGLD